MEIPTVILRGGIQTVVYYSVTCNPAYISMSLPDIPALPTGTKYKAKRGASPPHTTVPNEPDANDYEGDEQKARHDKSIRFVEFIYHSVAQTVFESLGAVGVYIETLARRYVGRCAKCGMLNLPS
jgi:hypothetical protein